MSNAVYTPDMCDVIELQILSAKLVACVDFYNQEQGTINLTIRHNIMGNREYKEVKNMSMADFRDLFVRRIGSTMYGCEF